MANEKRRLIDANALAAIFAFLRKMWSGTEIMAAIDEAPTVDAVEVIRCKDCKHGGILEHTGNVYCKNPLGHNGCVPTKSDAFCSYGERKDDDD